jgi:hypothetical protein
MTARLERLMLAALVSASTLAGCASALDVGYPEGTANRALLASAAPRRIAVGPVTDRRADQARIGAEPEDGDAITTSRPVAEIVRDALVVELTKNGHVVVPGDADIRLAADVEDFWLDAAARDDSTQYVGRVALALAVSDGRSGATLFVRRYAGLKRRQAASDSRDAWREVMDTALARTIRDIATDPELVAALARWPAAGQRADRPVPAGTAGSPPTTGDRPGRPGDRARR